LHVNLFKNNTYLNCVWLEGTDLKTGFQQLTMVLPGVLEEVVELVELKVGTASDDGAAVVFVALKTGFQQLTMVLPGVEEEVVESVLPNVGTASEAGAAAVRGATGYAGFDNKGPLANDELLAILNRKQH
jgi:hypothetical protein